MTISTDSEILLTLTQLQSRIQKRLDGALSIHGVSFTEFQVMRSLAQSPDMTMKRVHLADSVGLTASGVTRLLAPMEKIGLVSKQANARDARVSLVKLTTTGSNLLKDLESTLDRTAESLLSGLKQMQKSRLMEAADMLL